MNAGQKVPDLRRGAGGVVRGRFSSPWTTYQLTKQDLLFLLLHQVLRTELHRYEKSQPGTATSPNTTMPLVNQLLSAHPKTQPCLW